MSEIVLFKFLDIFVYGLAIILAIVSSSFLYTGLSTHTERLQTRIRLRHSFVEGTKKLKESTEQSNTEKLLKKASHPLGLTAIRYNSILFIVFGILMVNYIFVPLVVSGSVNMWSSLIILVLFLMAMPHFPYSLFRYMINRVIEYREAKRNAEIFMLYDMLTINLKAMTNTRINTYNLLNDIKPYFEVIDKPFTRLLSDWTSNKGPQQALDDFGKELGTKEAKAIVGVLKTLDQVNIHTAIEALQGMNDMFIRSQIENYRRRRKVSTDLLSIPIKSTHFLIILNFLIVIIVMVTTLISTNQSNLPSSP